MGSKREAQANLIRFLPRLMTYVTAEFIRQTDQGSIIQGTDWESTSLYLKGLQSQDLAGEENRIIKQRIWLFLVNQKRQWQYSICLATIHDALPTQQTNQKFCIEPFGKWYPNHGNLPR